MRDIMTVAKYEGLATARSVVFRVLACVILLVIVLIQVFMQGNGMAYNWTMVAMASSMSLVNAYFFNIMQAFLVIFLVSDYPVRESRRGALECIHARPVSNGHYLLGKFLGTIGVLLGLNILIILCCSFLNLVASEAPWNPLVYVFYFFTLTIPSLVFWVGLSGWISFILRGNKVWGQVLLLVLLGLTVVVFPDVIHGSLDSMGSEIPNFFSAITGHVDLCFYLLHRFAFLFVGIGCVCMSVCKLKRLPNSLTEISRWRRTGYLLVGLGVMCGVIRTYSYYRTGVMREIFRNTYTDYWQGGTCRVVEHDIIYRQTGKCLSLKSDMLLCNSEMKEVPRVILFLNPGLKVTSVSENEKQLKFFRDHQVIVIDRKMVGVDSVRLHLEYTGEIDERYCYLSVPDDHYYDRTREDPFFQFGNRYCMVDHRFTWLPPECGWYPVALMDSPVNRKIVRRNYTRYRLTVIEPEHPVVLSQGVRKRKGDTLRFVNPNPLEGISLCGGDYVCRQVQTSGFVIKLYCFREKDFVPLFFTRLNEKDVRNIVENRYGNLHVGNLNGNGKIADVLLRHDWCSSPESNLILAEVPLSITSYGDPIRDKSALVQPGMIFFPERAIRGKYVEAPRQYKRFAMGKGKRCEGNEKCVEESMFTDMILNFASTKGQSLRNPFLYRFTGIDSRPGEKTEGLLNALSLLQEPDLYIKSEHYPVVDILYKKWLREGRDEKRVGYSLFANKEDQYVYEYLQSHSLKDALSDATLPPDVWERILDMKSRQLLGVLETYTSREQLWLFLNQFRGHNRGEVELKQFVSELRDSLNVDIMTILPGWYNESCPDVVYQVEDASIECILNEGKRATVGKFKIWNKGPGKGVVSVIFASEDRGREERRLFHLDGGECKQVRLFLGSAGYFVIDLGISQNIPGFVHVEMDVLNDGRYFVQQTNDTCYGIFDAEKSAFAPAEGEIVVDNESADFQLVSLPEKWLQKIFPNKADVVARSSGGPKAGVSKWTKSYSGVYWGDTIRSMYYKMGGHGECRAEWTVPIEEPGEYEVFTLIHEFLNYEPSEAKELQYFYTILRGEERQEVVLDLGMRQRGWVSLGVYHLDKGETKVILDDRGEKWHFICADAVKVSRVTRDE